MSKLTLLLVCLVSLAGVFADISVANEHEHHDNKLAIKNYELKNGNLSIKFSNWGASVVSLCFPDKQGKIADVVLGYDNFEAYKKDTAYFGAVVGRVANRIGKAKFTLNGTTYILAKNDGNNTLHGGKKGFSDVVWKVSKVVKDGPNPSITFTYESKDGEEGYPGDLSTEVTYTLMEDQKLLVHMKATALTKATPVNLAQHTYWNLGGHDSGDILSNEVELFASQITPTDNELIPTGKITAVKHTPYDFLTRKTVGSRINKLPKGYDINYVVDDSKSARLLKKVAVVCDPKSGRVLKLWSNQPGVQFYTGNMLKDVKGKGGAVYGPHAALCLETQGFPDAVNHPNFPSVIVNPGKSYKHIMLYAFEAV